MNFEEVVVGMCPSIGKIRSVSCTKPSVGRNEHVFANKNLHGDKTPGWNEPFVGER